MKGTILLPLRRLPEQTRIAPSDVLVSRSLISKSASSKTSNIARLNLEKQKLQIQKQSEEDEARERLREKKTRDCLERTGGKTATIDDYSVRKGNQLQFTEVQPKEHSLNLYDDPVDGEL